MNRRATVGGLAALGLSVSLASATDVPVVTPAPKLVAELAPSGRLRVAINLGNVVLAQKGGSQGATGPTVDIANALGARLGVPVDLIIYDTSGLVVARLDQDRWDIAFLAVDPARGEQIQFTAPYVYIDGTYLVRAEAPFRDVADLDRSGVRIAVGQGTAYELYLTRTLKNATLVRSASSKMAIDQFIRDNLEAVAGVRQALVDVQKATPAYRVLPDSFSRIDQAVAIPKGREAGLAYIIDFIENLKASGFMRAALDRAGQSGALVAPPVNVMSK